MGFRPTAPLSVGAELTQYVNQTGPESRKSLRAAALLSQPPQGPTLVPRARPSNGTHSRRQRIAHICICAGRQTDDVPWCLPRIYGTRQSEAKPAPRAPSRHHATRRGRCFSAVSIWSEHFLGYLPLPTASSMSLIKTLIVPRSPKR